MMSILLAAAAATAAPAPCPPALPIAGASDMIGRADLRWLIVGEQHGTAESAVAFADLACLASATGRKIVIALEYPADDQARLDRFLASDGTTAARDALLSAPAWRSKMQDGRFSIAMFELIDRLRRMRAAGLIEGVVGFQPADTADAATYEQRMADLIQRAGADQLVLALVGNVHARTTIWTRSEPNYMPMAGLLPPAGRLTLNIVGNGGAQWACFLDPQTAPTCAARDFGPARESHPRGVALSSDPSSPYGGALYLGTPTTASPPAIAN
jgi:hypothetical protein